MEARAEEEGPDLDGSEDHSSSVTGGKAGNTGTDAGCACGAGGLVTGGWQIALLVASIFSVK